MKKNSLLILSFLIILIVWGYFNIWRSPKFYLELNNCQKFENVLTMNQYGNVVDIHERPFIINNEKMLVFGSEHSKNSDDPQFELMDSLFNAFQPTTVLVEGRLGFLIPFAMNPIKNYGEMGHAAALAKKHNLELFSWETPKNELIKALQKDYSPEQIAMKEILTPYFGNLRFGKPENPDAYVESYLERADWVGLGDKIRNIKDIDAIWSRDFPNEKDWRDTSDQYGLPGYLNAIAESSNYIRNQNLVCAINGLIENGKRVFVVCGSSHAVCIEPQLIN